MTTSLDETFADLDPSARAKIAKCQELLRQMRRVVVAFSGGVDSTFLLALARRTLGRDNVLAVVGMASSMPQRELAQARELAEGLDAECRFVTTGEMADERFTANSPERCYFCKINLFPRLCEIARAGGYNATLSGANADDTRDYRPGLKAEGELGIRSPLMEAGLTKPEIRAASRLLGLPTWDKPAAACLASRVPYGEPITKETLGRIERAENILKDMGFPLCRVRDHGTIARIEVPPDQIAQLLSRRQELADALTALGYAYVTADLKGYRTGSMNETL